jgi:hypothetical protein
MRLINPLDSRALREKVRQATPFPNLCIDNFLSEEFAARLHDVLPTYEEARRMGREFAAVNEKRKVQIVDSSKFPPPLKQLNEMLASRDFLDLMSYAFEIPNLLADDELVGGGVHETGPQGRLDVHVDFNYMSERALHRRLNLLLYLNKGWREDWGGRLELWDKDVKVCQHSFSPVFNRCIVFETSEISFHGVTAVTCPKNVSRKSFAAYYYTREAPAHWTGVRHSTIFKARPDEKLKGVLLMPAERAIRWTRRVFHEAKRTFRGG